VQVVYNPQRISYEELLDAYWKMIDPTRDDGQFCD
jgi:peptide methionine sulfoxide reductase MsrA